VGSTDPSTPVPTPTAVIDPVVLKQFDALNSALETLLTTISSAALPSESFLTPVKVKPQEEEVNKF
jgi:hypothetical protein